MDRRGYRFGLFEFDAVALELRKKGRLSKVRPQALKLLALLLESPGEVISRDDIRQALWGDDTFVDVDQGVNHCIKQLRGALGDDADSPRYVETLPRRGYRFIAPVERIPTESATATTHDTPRRLVEDSPPRLPEGPHTYWEGRRRAVYLAVGGAVVLLAVLAAQYPLRAPETRATGPVTLAVMPFTSEADHELGLGLGQEIARRLGSQRAVSVKSVRAGVDASQAGAAAVSGVGEAGISLVLEGDIRRTGDTVAVSARLTNTGSQELTWSQRFTVRADEIFSVEDVIAARVVDALSLRLAAPDQARLRRRYTSHASAYEQYLHGRAAMAEYTPEGTFRATAAFGRALAEDPDFTLARAGLAAACADMYLRFASPRDSERWAECAETEARRALDLDRDLAEAHLARAAVARKREFDWEMAIVASRRALVLNPTLDQAHFFIAAAYYHLGFMEEALLEMERGRRIGGPDVVEPLRIEALVALFSGRFAPAVAQLEEVSRKSSQPIGDTYLALAHYYSGNVDRALRMLEALATHASASTGARAGAALASVLAARGDGDRAEVLIRRVLEGEYRDHHVAYGLGTAYAQLGDPARAIQWLRTAADTGFPCVVWLERDPLLDRVRTAAAFVELLDYVRSLRESTAGRIAESVG